MSCMHTPRIASEEQISHLPGAVFFSGPSKGIDMNMHQIEVSLLNGEIIISQDSDGAEGQQSVVITAEQAELVCAWIMGAANTMKAGD